MTSALKPGENKIEVKVTNGWANRIIGDRQPNSPKQYTFTTPKFYKATAPLWASGLLGPVQIVQSSTMESTCGADTTTRVTELRGISACPTFAPNRLSKRHSSSSSPGRDASWL